MATSSAQVSRTITSLPQEMKDMIADSCELADLPTLRLLDRGFDTSGKQTLGKRYMQTRTHVYTTHSLTELEKITADPGLAKHIQKIVLCYQKYMEPEEHDACAACEETWEDFFEAQLPGRSGTQLLQSIFCNLKRTRELFPTTENIVFSISQSPEEETYTRPWGCQEFRDREALMALLEASTNEQSPIQELDARYHAAEAFPGDPGPGFYFNCSPSTSLQPSWTALRSLKLDFGRQIVEWGDDCWAHFRDYISAAPNLEKISLALTGIQLDSSDPSLARMGESLKDSKITSLELGPWLTTTNTLLDFLKVHTRTVRSLRLFRVGLSGTERSQDYAWPEVLGMVAAELELSKIEVFQVWGGDVYPFARFDSYLRTKHFVGTKNGDEPFMHEGTTAIKQGLSELASNGVYLEERVWCAGSWPYDDYDWSEGQPDL
ncbi:hypothetical protein LTR15_001599 [Elasticomyces elasticus]|nr:hypothetical protein LTR15_001599 [Elasticomyces elasticus]